jgi:hypothetical protein
MQGTWHDTPALAAQIDAGMDVEKVGRTTGHTTGRVLALAYGPVGVQYVVEGITYAFSGEVYFEPVYVIEGNGQAFSEEGDSGSLVTAVKEGQRYAVGLIIGGAKGQGGVDYTLVLPIQAILDKLGVTLVGGHNV